MSRYQGGDRPAHRGKISGFVERVASVPHGDQTATTESPLVLIVDDHAAPRAMLAAHLRLAGFRTAEAENGVLAIKTARELKPDASCSTT